MKIKIICREASKTLILTKVTFLISVLVGEGLNPDQTPATPPKKFNIIES